MRQLVPRPLPPDLSPEVVACVDGHGVHVHPGNGQWENDPRTYGRKVMCKVGLKECIARSPLQSRSMKFASRSTNARPLALAASSTRQSRRGQSVVEFALVAPIMFVIALAIIDLARVYTTMLTVESAAREAADYGTFGSQKWNAAVYNFVPDGTEAKMRLRACVASKHLPDYVGPDDSCTNPTISYQISGDLGASWGASNAYDPVALACDNPTREPPCWLKVTLEYDFRLLVPFNIEIGGTQFGVPSTMTFERSSVFPMTDLDLP